MLQAPPSGNPKTPLSQPVNPCVIAGFGTCPLQREGLLATSRTCRGPARGKWWWYHDKANEYALVLQEDEGFLFVQKGALH